jgi:class 3 adenylate cyclase/tetratricopeptide (TPR) repeat protein
MEGIKMQCPKCQFDNADGMNFCGKCGTKLERFCPQCDFGNPSGYEFCGKCGHRLFLPSEPISKELSFDDKLAKIQKYLPKGLTEKILSQRDRIEGERKQVTVMFCDMEAFTQLSEKLGPEDVYTIMDQVYEILIHKVHEYEGTVNEMTGDGIMALFGAPIALEDAPQRAIRSAYSIHREMTKFNKKLNETRSWISPIKMRIGIHSGPVVVGTLGNDLRVEFKVVGDTVNLASRIEGLAEPAATYVSEGTFKQTEGFFRFESLGKKKIKGKSEPIEIYRVIAPSTRKTRFDVSAERGLTKFVGRERELELLLDGFERAKSGRGQAFSIMAEAGLGKSRLLYEFRKAVANEDITFLEGRCLSYSSGKAYHPIVDILMSNFDIQEKDKDSEISEKVKNGLKKLKIEETLCYPYIMNLLSVKGSDSRESNMTPEMMKYRINEALKKVCLRGSELRPLVMAFEDLHWIDKSSEESLKNWLNSISGARVLMIFTYRPDYVHSWGGKSYHNQVNLNRLSNRESLLMASNLLDELILDRNLEEFILEKTEGVPFFIEEFIRSLKEIKIIKKSDNKYFLSRDFGDVSIPATIHDIIMARVDSLPEGAKEILRTGAVIEREFSYDLIKQLMDLSETELLSYLSVLRDSELIYERGLYPHATCVFKHALTRQVVYDSIMLKRRKKLHEEIGNVIEEVYKDNLYEHYAVLAQQYIKSESCSKGIEYSIKAGDQSVGIFAWHEARNHYENALQILEDDNTVQRAEVLRKLALVTMSDLDVETSLDYAQNSLKLYEALEDQHHQLEVLMHIQSIYSGGFRDGSMEDNAIKYLEKAAAIVEKEPDNQDKGLIYQRTAHLYLHRGQPAVTRTWAQKAEDLFARLGIPMGTSLGTALTYTGQIDAGFSYNEKNWEPVLKSGNPLIIALLGHELALTRALLRDVPQARDWGERILPEVKKAGGRYEGFLWRPLSLIYTLSGEFAKAEEACRAEREIEKKTLMSCFFEDAAGIGFYYLRKGDWKRAQNYLDWALPIHKERNNVAAIGACYYIQGNLFLEKKNYEKAEKFLIKSLEICRNGGNVIFELWVLPSICEVHLKKGQFEGAAEYINRGFELLKPDQNWYGLAAPLYLVKAMLAAKERSWDMAAEYFAKADQLNLKFGLPWDEAKTNYEWSKMLVARAQRDDEKNARKKHSRANDVLQRLGIEDDAVKRLIEESVSIK